MLNCAEDIGERQFHVKLPRGEVDDPRSGIVIGDLDHAVVEGLVARVVGVLPWVGQAARVVVRDDVRFDPPELQIVREVDRGVSTEPLAISHVLGLGDTLPVHVEGGVLGLVQGKGQEVRDEDADPRLGHSSLPSVWNQMQISHLLRRLE